MPVDFAFRRAARDQITSMARDMASWENTLRVSEAEQQAIRERIVSYTPRLDLANITYSGTDGTGDYPVLNYADSFIYATKAQCVAYRARARQGLKQIGPAMNPVFNVAWIPEAPEDLRHERFDAAMEHMTGRALRTIVEESDYGRIKAETIGKRYSSLDTIANLIRPHAHDSSNIGIQFRSVGELSALARALDEERAGHLALMDGTLSLPMVTRDQISLFQEHLKRWCCVRARELDTTLVWLSKSHGLPGIETIENLAAETLGKARPSHWFVRLPLTPQDWQLEVVDQRNLPPPGAVTYLWRTHPGMPVYRIDLDRTWWASSIQGTDETATQQAEVELFQRLDYACHDMRCHGYPYPIKAAHDEAHWTRQDRAGLRKQVIDAVVAAGMKRSAFIDVSQRTGHA